MSQPRSIVSFAKSGSPPSPTSTPIRDGSIGHRHGPVQPQDRRLSDGGPFARRTAIGGPADGHLGEAARRRLDPPFRSRRSIRLGRLPQDAGFKVSISRKADCYDNAPMESFFHTLKTELVRHRHYATGKKATRDIFAYRGLQRSNASPLRHRLRQPDRDGTKSSLTLSIFSGEDQSINSEEVQSEQERSRAYRAG